MLVFTDGLIERRGDSIEEVLSEFVATVAASQAPGPADEEAAGPGGGPTAAARADRILADAVSDTDDDACLVVVRVR